MNQRRLSPHQKVPLVCFGCRTSVKFPLWMDVTCPRCKKPMAFLGRYFKVPPQRAIKQWRKVELLCQKGWEADGYSAGPRTLREAREHPSASAVQSALRRTALKLKTEERWQRLRLKQEHLKRHRSS